jgi:hypothetical protein
LSGTEDAWDELQEADDEAGDEEVKTLYCNRGSRTWYPAAPVLLKIDQLDSSPEGFKRP